MTWGGFSSVSAQLEPACYKNNEIQNIHVQQKFTAHALYCKTSKSQDNKNYYTPKYAI